MKTTKYLIAIAAVALTTLAATAQTTVTTDTNNVVTVTTNTPAAPASFSTSLKEMATAISSATNWAIVAGGGMGVEKTHTVLAYADVVYDFSEYVGVLAGVDFLHNKTAGSQYNSVKGGVTLKLPMHPFAFIGSTMLTNIVATPYIAECLATSSQGGNVANLTVVGANFKLWRWKNLDLGAGAAYETRNGAGDYSGHYALIHLDLSRNF